MRYLCSLCSLGSACKSKEALSEAHLLLLLAACAIGYGIPTTSTVGTVRVYGIPGIPCKYNVAVAGLSVLNSSNLACTDQTLMSTDLSAASFRK